MILLKQTATVYGEDATTKLYTVVLKSNLRCTLLTVSGGQNAQERSELNQIRRLFWDATYPMPNYAQLEIDGKRYNPQRESIAEYKGNIGNVVMVYACDVVEVKT